MIPILFASDATDFSTNGIGRLECLSCKVTEERNGIYELEAVIPVEGNHAKDVVMDSIIGVIPHDGGTIQGFRVYEITKPLNGKFTVHARHISYQLLDMPVMPFEVVAGPTACATTLASMVTYSVENCPFTFWTDVTTNASYKYSAPAPIRTRLLGSEGSVLDQFGGEYEWDNWAVKLHYQRGRMAMATGITLRYGKNIVDLEQEENISNVVTGVVPYWSDYDGENLVTLPERAVYSQYADRYPFKRTIPLDLSERWEEAPSVENLRAAAQAYVNATELGMPRVSIKVSFVPLWQSEEYKDLLPLQRVQLCDEINVEFEKYGITRTAKIVKTVFDVLKERYDSIEVGSMRSSFTTALNDQNAAVATAIERTKKDVGQAVDKATAWLLSGKGYIVAIKGANGEWQELLAMDTPDINTAQKVMRFNMNGIGGSTSGASGPYNAAMLVDGTIVATMIKAGVLTDLNNKFSLNMETGSLNMQDGNFSGTITSSSISGGSISGTTISGSTIKSVSGDTELRINNGAIEFYYQGTKQASMTFKPQGTQGQAGIFIEAQGINLKGNYCVWDDDLNNGDGGFFNLTQSSAKSEAWISSETPSRTIHASHGIVIKTS